MSQYCGTLCCVFQTTSACDDGQKPHGADCESRHHLCGTGTYPFTVDSSVQDAIYVLKKALRCPTPSHRSFHSVAFNTVPMFVWLTIALSRPFKEDHLALPLCTPLSSRQMCVCVRGEGRGVLLLFCFFSLSFLSFFLLLFFSTDVDEHSDLSPLFLNWIAMCRGAPFSCILHGTKLQAYCFQKCELVCPNCEALGW